MESIYFTVSGNGPNRFSDLEVAIHELITKLGYIAVTGRGRVSNEYSVDVRGLPQWLQKKLMKLHLSLY